MIGSSPHPAVLLIFNLINNVKIKYRASCGSKKAPNRSKCLPVSKKCHKKSHCNHASCHIQPSVARQNERHAGGEQIHHQNKLLTLDFVSIVNALINDPCHDRLVDRKSTRLNSSHV